MNICRLNVSSKMCVNFAPACISHRALKRLKNRTLRFIGYCRRSPRCSPLLSAERRYSPLSAAERKYHLATARPYNEANTVGRD